MKSAPNHPREAERLEALRRFNILDTAAEQSFDDLTNLASFICQTPMALISLVDEHRQWFKARVGVTATETPRSVAFCAHAILEDDVFVIDDAHADDRFHDNPLVTGEPHIRFYAGATVNSADGHPLGTVCVMDTKPRTFSAAERSALRLISRIAGTLLEYRLASEHLAAANETFKLLSGILPICSACKKIRDEEGQWHLVETFVAQRTDATFSHGICPDCTERLYPGLIKSVKKD